MLLDLVQTTTRDGIRLDGSYQTSTFALQSNVDVFVCVHGTGGNFYSSTLFDALGQRLLALGCGVLRINTRGHDLMCNVTRSGVGLRLGAAYEILDDCRHDLSAWVDWLKQNGCGRIGLVGHSSGAVKCLYSQAHEPAPAVARVIAISPPRLSHSWYVASEKAAEFLHTYQQAKSLVEAGEPGFLLDVRLPLPFIVTAAGYVEKYGPDERYNYLHLLDRIRCPVLLTLGEVESAQNVAFRGAAEAAMQQAPAIKVEMVAGADHFYTHARESLLARVEDWLRRSPDAAG